tara:strand:+ start:112 stop:498 length:387 start_codon:yes stop_codon:yes gene_type:complete
MSSNNNREEELKIQVGKRLRMIRLASGKSQAEVAKENGYTRSHLYAVENQDRGVSVEFVQKMAAYWGTTMDALVKPLPVVDPKLQKDFMNQLAQSIPYFTKSDYEAILEVIEARYKASKKEIDEAKNI